MNLADLVREALALGATASVSDDDGPGTLEAWDSIAHLRLLAAIEKSYKVTLQPEDLAGGATVGKLRDLLRRKGVAQP